MFKKIICIIMVFTIIIGVSNSYTILNAAEQDNIKIKAEVKDLLKKDSIKNFGINVENSMMTIDIEEVSQKDKNNHKECKYKGTISFTDGKKDLKFSVDDISIFEYEVNNKSVKHGSIDCWLNSSPITISLYTCENNFFAHVVFGDMENFQEAKYGDYFSEIAELEKIRLNETQSDENTASTLQTEAGTLEENNEIYQTTGTMRLSYYDVGYVGIAGPSKVRVLNGDGDFIARMWSDVEGMNDWYLSTHQSDEVVENEVTIAELALDFTNGDYFNIDDEDDINPEDGVESVSVPIPIYNSGEWQITWLKITTGSTEAWLSEPNSNGYQRADWELKKSAGFRNKDTELEASSFRSSKKGFACKALDVDYTGTRAGEKEVFSEGRMKYALFILEDGNENHSYTKYYWTPLKTARYDVEIVD